MRHLGLEEIQGLFQTWPSAFKDKFKRELTKAEILSAIKERTKLLEIQEIKSKFDTYSYAELCLVRDYLLSTDIEHIDAEKQLAQEYEASISNKANKKRLV